ncbi:MAG: YihY/virulence factor BrkB family protein [Parvibaculaceae bacterium]
MLIDSAFNRLRGIIWETPLRGDAGASLPVWQVGAVRTAQIAWVVVRDLLNGRLSLRAMSLVYTTLLSLVPTIAIAFVVFRTFGYAIYVQDFLAQMLAPLGEQGTDITVRIMEFVDRVNTNVLGTVGFVFLLYTVISLVKKIEAAFNDIWRVESSRSLARQFTDFISMGVLGPLVLFTALGIMAGALSNAYVGTFIDYGPIKFAVTQMSKIVPYVVLIATFTFIYSMIPNTRVNLLSAFVGATVAGIAWGVAGWGFATFVVKSAQYVAVYSAFASLVVFMIWLYASWLILLVGCAISFYFQKRNHLSPSIGLAQLTPRQQSRMAVQTLVLIHEAYERGGKSWTEDTLARRLNLPIESMVAIEAILSSGGFIARSDSQPPHLVPAIPAQKVRISDIMACIRANHDVGSISNDLLTHLPKVQSFYDRVTEAETTLFTGTTIADLLHEPERSSVGE